MLTYTLLYETTRVSVPIGITQRVHGIVQLPFPMLTMEMPLTLPLISLADVLRVRLSSQIVTATDRDSWPGEAH